MTQTLAKAPSAQWYLADWERDLELMSCSFAAQGLWKRLLCKMHFATPRGYLRTPAGPIKDEQIVGLIPAPKGEDILSLVRELEAAGVFSRDKDGAIFNRRMAREGSTATKRSHAGKMGWVAKQAKGDHDPPSEPQANVKQNSAEADAGAVAELSDSEIQEEFDSLWAACARKVNRGQAWTTYQKLRRQGSLPSVETVIARLKAMQRTKQWSKDGREFQPHLSTWLNREGWLDEVEPMLFPGAGCQGCGDSGYKVSTVTGTSYQCDQCDYWQRQVTAATVAEEDRRSA